MVFGCLKIGDLAKISFNREDNDKPWDVGPTLLGFWRSLGDRPLLKIDPSCRSTSFFFGIFRWFLRSGFFNARPSRIPISSNIQDPRCEYICPMTAPWLLTSWFPWLVHWRNHEGPRVPLKSVALADHWVPWKSGHLSHKAPAGGTTVASLDIRGTRNMTHSGWILWWYPCCDDSWHRCIKIKI